MSFLNPLFLFGFLLISIPIILHLLTKRKAKKIEFAATEFIKIAHKKRVNITKLKNFIVLLLRILTIIFLTLAFSKPIVTTSSNILLSILPKFQENKNFVLILDNSYSMDYNNRFNRVKKIAQDIIDSVNEKDYGSLILTSDEDPIKFHHLTNDFEIIKKEIKNADIKNKIANIRECVEYAINILKEGKNLSNEIYILSDMQKISWKDMINFKTQDIKIYCLNFSDKNEKNLYLQLINYPCIKILKGEGTQIIYKICSYGEVGCDKTYVSLILNNKLLQKKLVEINKEVIQEVNFNSVGDHKYTIKLEADNLNFDNELNFFFQVKEAIKVLLIQDDNKPYIKLALRPNEKYSQISVERCNSLDVVKKNINNYDVLILSNIKMIENIKDKNILVFLGDKIDKAFYQNILFPYNMIEINELKEEQVNLVNVDSNHYIFKEIIKMFDINKLQFYKFYQLTTTEGLFSEILSEFTGGIPAIIELTINEHKILIFNTYIDEEWTNLQFNPLFAPLIQNTIYYLAGITPEEVKKITTPDIKESTLDKINIKKFKNIKFIPIENTLDYLKKESNKIKLTELMILLCIFCLIIELFLSRRYV